MSFEKSTVELPVLDPSTLTPALNPILVVDGAGLEKVRQFLSEPREYVLDYETNVVKSHYQRKARTLQLGNKDVQFVIDFLAFADGSEEKLWAAQGHYRRAGKKLRKWWQKSSLVQVDPSDATAGYHEVIEKGFNLVDVNPATLAPVVDVIRPSMDSDLWLKIGYNLEFEYIVSKWCLGIRPWHFYDVFMGERLLYNGAVNPLIKGFWGLTDACGRRFGFNIPKDEQKGFDLCTPLTTEQITYCAVDVRMPWSLKADQQKDIRKAQVGWTLQIENNATPAFGDMHINGVYVNPEKWEKIIDDNKIELKEKVAQLDELFIPIVGRKEYPDPERVAAADAAWKKLRDEKSPEELAVADKIKQAKLAANEEIKAAKKAKDLDLVARLEVSREARVQELMQERKRLEEERERKKDEAKAYYKSISYLATKGFADEFAKMDGEAKINYGAWQQVLPALQNAPMYDFNEKNLPNLNAKTTLVKFMHMPIIKTYVEFKQVGKSLETYGYRWITPSNEIARESNEYGWVDPDTGRIHSSFRQHGTDTGRPSSTNPNLLNLPKDPRFREPFEAREGFDMVTKDCSGQELRILCDYSKEPSWVDAFTTDKDVHSISARMFRKLLWDENALPNCAFFHDNFKKCKCPVHKKTRDRYKAVTLGVIMGKQAYSLSIEMGISVDDAQDLIDEWFVQFQYNKAAIERNQEEAYAKGEARTRSGRRRIIRRVKSAEVLERLKEKYPEGHTQYQYNYTLDSMVAAVKREAGNVPYQGTGADLMKQAMGSGFDPEGRPYLWHIVRELEEKFGDDVCMLLNYIYDEFLYETRTDLSELVGGKDGVGGLVSDAIVRAGAEFVTTVPMASEGAIAKSWSK